MGSWRSPSEPAGSVREIAHRLTERDRLIVADLARCKLLTLEQLERLYFNSNSSARDRIAALTEMGLLQRFRPHTRAGYRYLLGLHGLKLVHANRVEDYERDPEGPFLGERKPKPGRAPSKASAEAYADRIIASTHRSHLEGCNDFYSRLAAACRHDSRVELAARWYTEAETDSISPLTDLRADGSFDLDTPHGEAAFYYEHDTGTEPLTRLVRKAETFAKEADRTRRLQRERIESGYEAYRVVGYMVIEMTKPGRETNFHQALAARGSRAPVATTTVERSADPLGPIWRPVGALAAARRRLEDLPILL